jgi:hypothetical protein
MTRPKLFTIVFVLLFVAYFRPPNTILASERAASAAAPPDSICTKAGQFCVNRETSSGVCHVQEATERPQLGTSLAGPFNSRAEGNAGMCRLYEPASGDADKCGAVAPQGICDSK